MMCFLMFVTKLEDNKFLLLLSFRSLIYDVSKKWQTNDPSPTSTLSENEPSQSSLLCSVLRFVLSHVWMLMKFRILWKFIKLSSFKLSKQPGLYFALYQLFFENLFGEFMSVTIMYVFFVMFSSIWKLTLTTSLIEVLLIAFFFGI